jgi:hypothetical protein
MSSLRKKQETIPFTRVSKKYLGINLTKEMKDFYNQDYKTLKKESKEDTIEGNTTMLMG